MKDANPRIFRSLETAAGSAEFDTIVAAAVSTYGALRQPSEAQARDFARLVLPVWDRLRPETKRALGASLSHSPRVPRGVVEKLLGEPIEIGAPFLVSSPVLTDDDRQILAYNRDQRLRRLAAEAEPRRPVAPPADVSRPAVVEARSAPSKAEPSPAVTPAPTIAQAEIAQAGIEQAEIAASDEGEAVAPAVRPAPGKAAAAVREALRRMVQLGRPSAAPAMTVPDLVEIALRGEAATTLACIGSMAGIGEDTLSQIAEDETGERLAVALKALDAGDADAMTVLMMLRPKVGLDVAVFDLMADYYRSLKHDDCFVLVGATRRVEAPAHVPMYDGVERRERPAARAAFGRRAERPALGQTRSA